MVSCDTGNQVLMCMEVCKEWHAAVQMTASKLSLVNNRRPMEALLTICKFKSLRTLYIKDCNLRGSSESKTLAFQALSGRCPQLIAIHFINVELSTEDAASLFCHCSSICTLELRDNGPRFQLPPVDHLTTLQSLMVGCTDTDRDRFAFRTLESMDSRARDLPPLHTLTRLTTLVLATRNEDFLPPMNTLSHLQSLQLTLKKIQSLPALSGCPFLKHLDLAYSPRLYIVDLTLSPALQSVIITHCTNLREIRGLEALTSLRTFIAWECLSLIPWPKLSNIQSLQDIEFDVQHIHQIVGLETLPRLRHLRLEVKAIQVSLLQPLRDIEQISLKLDSIGVDGRLDVLHNLSDLRGLRTLIARDLPMQPMEEIGYMRTLQHLEIIYCFIPPLARLTQLQSILLFDCYVIEEFPLLNNLANLTKLVVDSFSHLRKVPALDGTPNLQHLELTRCRDLESVPLVAHLQKLTHLDVKCCKNLKSLPDLPNSLQTLDFVFCESLVRLPSLDSLVHLQHLRGGCLGITMLPPLSSLVSLREMIVQGCRDLVAVPTLGGVLSMRALNVDSCEKLEQLPPLGMLRSLRKVSLVRCPRLTSLQYLEGVCEEVEVVTVDRFAHLRLTS